MKLLLIDDHQMFREGLSMFFQKHRAEWEIAGCSSIDQAIEIISKNKIDIIISDYHLPGKSIKELSEHLDSNNLEIPVIIVSMDTEISCIIKSLQYGARAYISKESSSFQVLESIESVMLGDFVFDQQVTGEIVSYIVKKSGNSGISGRQQVKTLSNREEEIFYLLINEKDIFEISDQLFISKKTVENHRTNIYRKLGVFDRYSLRQFAADNDFI